MKDWRDLIGKICVACHGDQKAFQELLEAQVDSYARRFFRDMNTVDGENDISEISVMLDVKWNGALSKGEQEQLIEKYKGNLYNRLTSVILVSMQKDYHKRLEQEFLDALKETKKIMNQKTSVHLYEEKETKEGEEEKDQESKFKGYIYRFAPLSKVAKVKSWTGNLDENGEASTSMTYIAWLVAGSPSKIDLWMPDADPDKDKPEFSVSFSFTPPKAEVPIVQEMYPTLDEVVGEYENGVLTMVDVQYASDEVKAKLVRQGCDPAEHLGETQERPFKLEKVDATTVRLVYDTKGWEKLGDTSMKYDEKTGLFTKLEIKDDGDSLTFEMSAVYSDAKKSGVVIGGDIILKGGSKAYEGVTAKGTIAGERSFE